MDSNQEKSAKRPWIREPFSGISHGVGAALSVIALVILLIVAQGRPWHTMAFAIYGASLVLLYTASTLYHSIYCSERGVERLQRFDHVAIFLLIAGTYTPLCLVAMRGAWGWSLFGIEYGLALIGIVGSLIWKRPPLVFRLVIYLCMGWLVLVALPVLFHLLPMAALVWLFAGGVAYSIGTVVFTMDKPHLWPGKFSAHDLWHIFVLAGSACHFVLMLCFIAPMQ